MLIKISNIKLKMRFSLRLMCFYYICTKRSFTKQYKNSNDTIIVLFFKQLLHYEQVKTRNMYEKQTLKIMLIYIKIQQSSLKNLTNLQNS